MTFLTCILLLAASTRVDLLDETPTIRHGEWNWYPVSLLQRPARADVDFSVLSGSRQVRIALMTHAEMERRHAHDSFDELAGTAAGPKGALQYRVPRPDEYVIVLDNSKGREDSTVHVRVALDFAAPAVTRLSPARQLTIVGLSFAFFFAVVTYSARRILRAIQN